MVVLLSRIWAAQVDFISREPSLKHLAPWVILRENLILLREGRCTIKISIRPPLMMYFSGFKSAINIRQMYFMKPLKPTSRCERIS